MSDPTNLIEIPFADALGERYLAYALSTIMSRSLPDIRDGLKPVHRRVLFAMHELKLDPKSNFKKCARIVGDAIGKYHPHSDAALYDTLVRLAQDFSLRYPLIEGQGNFGSIDGDNPAAMRYTESKLTPIALELLRDLEEDTVDFKPNYDGQELEPTILPAAFPNLLANGCEGIAVGMATSIPPHNLDELCQALEMLIKNPNTSLEEILTIVKGPDFPTAGLIIEDQQSILQSYKTGRGSFRLRAKWHKENLGHGLYRIIITEIPYQIQKLRLIEKIADLIKNKKLPLVNDVADESDANIYIAIEPKTRSVDAEILMESLFKNTDLEIRVPLNLNVLNKDLVPGVIDLKEALVAFLEFKEEVVLKRSIYRLNKINHRLEILDGFLIAYLNLDEVIRIIREEDEPKEFLMNKFSLSEVQVEAILNMKLRSLRRLEEFEIRKEHDELIKNKEKLEQIINDEKARKKVMLLELKIIRDKFGIDTPLGARRTEISNIIPADFGKIDIQAFIEKEPITVVCSHMGWIRSIKGHEGKEIKYKEGDQEQFVLKANTTDQIMIFTNKGKFYTILGDNLPKSKNFGDSTKLIFDFADDEAPISIFIYEANKKLLLVSNNGKGFILDTNEAVAQTKSGKKILNLSDNFEAKFCINVDGDHLAILGTNRKLLIMPISELPNMKKGQGVTIQKYKNAEVSDVKLFNKDDGFSWRYGKGIKIETNLIHWMGKKGASGKMPPIGFPRDNKF